MGLLGGVAGVASKVGRGAARGARRAGRAVRRSRRALMRAGLMAAFGGGGAGATEGQSSGASGILRSMGYNSAADTDITLPGMQKPERVSTPSNPSISSILKQLDALTKAAVKIGAITQEQQEHLIKQARAAEAASREAKTEGPAATPVAAEGLGESIEPGSDAISNLLEAIGALQEKLEDAISGNQSEEGGGLGGIGVFGGGRGRRGGTGTRRGARAPAQASPQLREGFTREGTRYRGPNGRFVTAETAVKNFRTVNPSALSQAAQLRQAETLATRGGILSRATGAVRGAGGAVKGAAIAATAGATAKIAGVMGRGTAAAGKAASRLAGPALKSTIARVARPLVAKAVAKTAIKSIPLVGAVAGGLFAIGRLLQGDVVGAGLEAASGLGGPLTAIPALVLSLARDVYTGVFGVHPETDPQVGERMGLVKEGVTALATAALSRLTTKEQPDRAEAQRQQPPNRAPRSPAQADADRQSAPSVSSSPPAPPPRPPGTQGGVGAPPAGSTGAPPAAGSDGGGSSPSPSDAGGGGGGGSPPAPGPLPTSSSAAASGAAIDAASGVAPGSTTPGGGAGGLTPPLPARYPTTRSNARGIGNVPDPTYMSMGELVRSLYFGSVAGAMA
jgi:hypothetical protein